VAAFNDVPCPRQELGRSLQILSIIKLYEECEIDSSSSGETVVAGFCKRCISCDRRKNLENRLLKKKKKSKKFYPDMWCKNPCAT
jgi:hypothetical protein